MSDPIHPVEEWMFEGRSPTYRFRRGEYLSYLYRVSVMRYEHVVDFIVAKWEANAEAQTAARQVAVDVAELKDRRSL